jgi:hypothetical protein
MGTSGMSSAPTYATTAEYLRARPGAPLTMKYPMKVK